MKYVFIWFQKVVYCFPSFMGVESLRRTIRQFHQLDIYIKSFFSMQKNPIFRYKEHLLFSKELSKDFTDLQRRIIS